MYENRENAFDNLNSILYNHKPVCVTDFKRFTEYLQKEEDKDSFHDKIINEVKSKVYLGFNMARDGLFLQQKSRMIMIFDYNEFGYFHHIADDLSSYCHNFDFNSIFFKENNYSLNDYYFDVKVKVKR